MQPSNIRNWKTAILPALLFAGTTLPASANTLYVAPSPTGSSSVTYAQMQSSATPATYQNAMDHALSGDKILFKPGTYNHTNMGSSSGFAIAVISKSNITLEAQNHATDTTSNRSIIQATSAEKLDYHTFYMQNQSNVKIIGLEISGALINNSTDKGRPTGISIEASDYVTCQYNIVHDNGGGGILSVATRDGAQDVLDASDYVVIDHNIVYNNCNYSPYEASGISLLHCKNANTGDTNPHSKITYNRVYNNIILDDGTGGGQHHTDGNGIIIDTDSGNNPSAGFSPSYPATGFTDMAGHAIPKYLVANNVVYGNGGVGIHVLSSANVTVIDNSTYSNAQDTTASPDEIDAQNGKNCVFANNIAYGNPGRTTLKVFQCYANGSFPASIVATNTWRYDTYYNTVAGTTPINLGTASQSNLLNLDPHYFYPPSGDLELGNFSPQAGIDNGSSLSADSLSPDILGVARPSGAGYDRGAYERVLTGAKAAPSGAQS